MYVVVSWTVKLCIQNFSLINLINFATLHFFIVIIIDNMELWGDLILLFLPVVLVVFLYKCDSTVAGFLGLQSGFYI